MSIYCPLSEALGILPPDHPIDYDDYSNCIPMDYIPIRHTDETKDAIRKALLGKPKSDKHKQSLRKPKRKGHKQSAEHKYKKAMNKSSEWLITYPDGRTEIVRNLANFCREQGLENGPSNLINGWSYKGYRAIKNG